MNNSSSATTKTDPGAVDDAGKQQLKPPRTLNRVPRACNACRKQKMRCEGADNPPCKRCRNASLECLFEKPSREASLTGEAGLERIRNLEAHVADIRTTQQVIRENQLTMTNSLSQLLHEVRASRFIPPHHRSPSLTSPSTSTPTGGLSDIHQPASHQISSFPHRRMSYSAHSMSPAPPQDFQSSHYSQSPFPHPQLPPPAHHTQLPPLSSLQGVPPLPVNNVSAMRYQHPSDDHSLRMPYQSTTLAGNKRNATASKLTSPTSSDLEDDDNGDLPARGLLAPLQVLQGLADVALENARNGEPFSEAPSRVPSPNRQSRPVKRRKVAPRAPVGHMFADVVTKNMISEQEAQDLFRIFYNGCSTFLPVFDIHVDTFDSLHERSPFAVNAICMAAARVRDGGGSPSETYTKIFDEVQHISRYTLFSPVTRCEAVQSMLIIAGWSDNGWLCGGHAVRMAMEVSLENSWPRLRKRMASNKMDPSNDRNLVTGTRAWFCLYLYEHQLSYGTGRPAMLRDDDSIRDSRVFLQHPLAVEDDMRLISTVELMALRERIQNAMGSIDGHIQERRFQILQEADHQFRQWFENWDHAFSQKYEDAAFYRQSLQIQQIFALLYHNASALTGINGPDDVQHIPASQRDLAMRSIDLAMSGLDIISNSSTYKQGMKYAVNYTHASATFVASFLLRLARLFPKDCNVMKIRQQVENLSTLMSEIPGKRYALTLQVMLKRSRKRSAVPNEQAPGNPDSVGPSAPQGHSAYTPTHQHPPVVFSPSYEGKFMSSPEGPPVHLGQQQGFPPYLASQQQPLDADRIWRGYESTSTEQLPVWLSDQTMGGKSLARSGMEAFLVPSSFLPAPQIW